MSQLNQLQLTIIWIRHAEKAYSNNRGNIGCLQHDPDILLTEHPRVQEQSKRLITRYGIPQLVFTSPYKRARQTAALMTEVCDINIRPEVQVDVQISEFLGYQDPRTVDNVKTFEPDIDPTTAMWSPPPIRESVESMTARITAHIQMLTLNEGLKDEPHQSAVIWVITHGIIIARIFDQLYNNIKAKLIHNVDYQAPWSSRSPHPLEGLSVIRKYKSLTMGLIRVPKPKVEKRQQIPHEQLLIIHNHLTPVKSMTTESTVTSTSEY
jgi:broad specificity phosphatase PhoE